MVSTFKRLRTQLARKYSGVNRREIQFENRCITDDYILRNANDVWIFMASRVLRATTKVPERSP